VRWFPLSASQKLRCITPRCARRVGATPFPSDRSACMRRNALPDPEDGPPEDDSSWTQELSIFKARKNKPSQLASLRNYQAASVSKGNVVAVRSSIAVVEGLNNDAEVGTSLKFGTGDVTGVLLWRRDDNTVFALVNDDDRVAVGEVVECAFSGILQVADEEAGPQTKRKYKVACVPVGDALVGKVVNFCGIPYAEANAGPVGTDVLYPLLNATPNMEDRESIDSPLLTQVKAIDIITPLGKGQALQVSGIQGSGKTQLCIQTVMGQRGTGVRCVYAAVGCSKEQVAETIRALERSGCMAYTTVIVATEDRGLGEQYAAICYAASLAERVRDEGGDSLVVFNTVEALVKLWDSITKSIQVDLNVAEGGDGGEELVEYEGMMISAQAAQRRIFFSSLIQRTARMHKRLKGGSLTGLFVVPGSPAQGRKPQMVDKVAHYKHLTEAQKAKLLKALEHQEASEQHDLNTEIVEEFMSMADGQVVLEHARDAATGGPKVDARLSVSRIGSRAYAPALADLASLVRFELAQANDAQLFAANAGTDPMARKALKRAEAVTAVLPQRPGTVCPLEHQVIQLLAVQQGILDNVPLEEVASVLEKITDEVLSLCPTAVAELQQTRMLTQTAKAAIVAALTT
jgi:F0F1-type ATP synthase alpha subunit